jgi:hypothetical protein
MQRLLNILWFTLLLPGLVVVLVGVFSNLVSSTVDATPPDPFPMLAFVARIGWGLLALGVLVYLLLGRFLGRCNPRLRAQAQAYTLQRFRYPRLAVIAAYWSGLVLTAIFAGLALVPRELASSLLALVGPIVHPSLDGILSVLLALAFGCLIAITPTLALRLLDRPR